MRTVLCGLIVFAVGCGTVAKTGTSAPPTLATYTREEFKQLVVGKTPEEVIKAVGKPDKTTETGGLLRWEYEKRTTDPVTGKLDGRTDVIFSDGKRVSSINF